MRSFKNNRTFSMFSKELIWSSFAKELHIIKHLATKVPAGKEHHKPTEKQRTTLELIQYLSIMGVALLRVYLEENPKAFGEYTERSKGVTIENFGEMMDKQESEMKEVFAKFTDAELNKEIELWGMKGTKAMFLLNTLKMLTGYKMQLFLYAKASGNHTLGTSNVWAGMDMPAPAAH